MNLGFVYDAARGFIIQFKSIFNTALEPLNSIYKIWMLSLEAGLRLPPDLDDLFRSFKCVLGTGAIWILVGECG